MYFVECVGKIRHILSVIHYTIRGAVCFQFIHLPCDWENIYILYLIIIIKSEVWTITHCLGLGHETMVCAVCRSVFLYTIIVLACFTYIVYQELDILYMHVIESIIFSGMSLLIHIQP